MEIAANAGVRDIDVGNSVRIHGVPSGPGLSGSHEQSGATQGKDETAYVPIQCRLLQRSRFRLPGRGQWKRRGLIEHGRSVCLKGGACVGTAMRYDAFV